jgi:mRNA-degrading endonuclease RelE of RelBE toxin-antitoxin system
MKTSVHATVHVSPQVIAFVKSLAPEPHGKLTRAIKALAENRGDIKRLEGKLEAFSRMRVTGHRVIFREDFKNGVRIIDCVFAEKRPIVYDLFVQLAAEELGQ